MSEQNVDVPLSLATAEDMLGELQSRGIAAALVMSHVQGGHYIPSADVPPEARERVVGDSFLSKHPAYKAAFLCQGIQSCLSEIEDAKGSTIGQHSMTLLLSGQMKLVQHSLELLLPK